MNVIDAGRLLLKLWHRRKRLEKLIEFNAPQVIIDNEKRMLKKVTDETEQAYKKWYEDEELASSVNEAHREKCYRCKWYWQEFTREQEPGNDEFGRHCKFTTDKTWFETMPCNGEHFSEDPRGDVWTNWKK